MTFQSRSFLTFAHIENVCVDTLRELCVAIHKAPVVPMELELEQYTPSEAEEITLVAQTTVRNWRRAGHLPRNDGHARYTVRELLVMTAMRSLVAKGVVPEVAKAFAAEVASSAFQAMIYQANAYSPEVHRSGLELIGTMPADFVQEFKGTLERVGQTEIPSEAEIERHWKEAAIRSAVTAIAARAFGVAGLKRPTWFIIWANGEVQFYYDEDISEEEFFGNTVWDEYVEGPVTLFCLGAIATMVLKRLPRPAIKRAGAR